MFKLSAFDAVPEIRAAVLAVKQIEPEARKQMNKTFREVANPVWQKLVSENMQGYGMERHIVLAGTRVAAGNPPRLIGASSRRAISRRGTNPLLPTNAWPLMEYGVGDIEATYQRRSKNGGTHKVTRHVARGFPERRRRPGRYFGPAARYAIPRIASHWVQSVLRTFFDALEEGR